MKDIIIWFIIPTFLVIIYHILFYYTIRLYILLSDANEIKVFPSAPPPLKRSNRKSL